MPDFNFIIKITDEQVASLVEALTTSKDDIIFSPDTVGDTEPQLAHMLDEHGVPWHPEYHSSVKKLTVNGRWKRVRRGDKIATNEYEAGYKEPFPDVAMPEPVPTPVDMPTAMPMPATFPEPEPVSYEAMLQAFKSAGERIGGEEATQALGPIYKEHGVDDPKELETDESKRAGVFEGLEAL